MNPDKKSIIMEMYDKLYDPERYRSDTDENIAARKCLDDIFDSENIDRKSSLHDLIMCAVGRHYEITSPYIFKRGFILGMKIALEIIGQ